MSRYARLLGSIMVLLLLSAVPAWSSDEEAEEWVGKASPEFAFQDLDGKDLTLAGLKGNKVVWLNFWGLRCGPCVRELPALQTLHEKYKDKGLLIIGVNADGVDADFIRQQFESREDLKAAGVKFPLVTDLDFAAIDAFGLMGAPLNVMIDRQGIIGFRHEGYEDGDEAHYEKVVQDLLAR